MQISTKENVILYALFAPHLVLQAKLMELYSYSFIFKEVWKEQEPFLLSVKSHPFQVSVGSSCHQQPEGAEIKSVGMIHSSYVL